MPSRTATAIMWGLKPLFDLIVLLLTIHKSAKFKQTSRPILIDMLIADGMTQLQIECSEL